MGRRDRRLPITPRNLLRHHSFAVPTVHTTHPVNEEDCDLQNRHKLKTTSLLSVVNGPLATADRADRPTSPPRSNVNIECQLLTLRPIDLSVHESLELLEAMRWRGDKGRTPRLLSPSGAFKRTDLPTVSGEEPRKSDSLERRCQFLLCGAGVYQVNERLTFCEAIEDEALKFAEKNS